MGHLAGKDVYRRLGQKIDGLQVRAPWTPALHAILKELYSEEEAELIVRMPYTLAGLERIAAVTGLRRSGLERTLEELCSRGLLIDLWQDQAGTKKYAISPMVVGIFEFTMMRAGTDEEHQRRARLFSEYLERGRFFETNLAAQHEVFAARALPPLEGDIRHFVPAD